MSANRLETIRQFMERQGIPGRDLYDLPTSPKTFPDGAHYRMEIAGIERASTLKAMIDEMKKRSLPIHRVIATVGGSTYCDFEELKEIVKEIMETHAPDLKLSEAGVADLTRTVLG